MLMKSVLVILCGVALHLVMTNGAMLNTYVGQDGVTYYYTALACESTSLMSYTLRILRKSYTAREDTRCCYWNVTRSSCCLSGSGSSTECRCSPSVTCGMPTTTSTTTSTTTPESTTSTSTPTTSTTTASTTTTSTSTTTTTTTSTTTPPKAKLCPLKARVLNGVKVTNECGYKGLANITTGNLTACHAVLTPAMVNGTYKTTFMTTSSCKNIIIARDTFFIQIGPLMLPLIKGVFNFIDDTNDRAYLDLDDKFRSLLNLLGPCQTTACPYNSATMYGRVNWSNCTISSYGMINSTLFGSYGLYEASVSMLPQSACDKLPKTASSSKPLCFTATSGLGLYCYGDAGAPVYCHAQETDEWILVGISQQSSSCDTKTAEFRVVPYSDM